MSNHSQYNRTFWDTCKTIIAIIAIVFAVTAYLRTGESGMLLAQRGLDIRIAQVQGSVAQVQGEMKALTGRHQDNLFMAEITTLRKENVKLVDYIRRSMILTSPSGRIRQIGNPLQLFDGDQTGIATSLPQAWELANEKGD